MKKTTSFVLQQITAPDPFRAAPGQSLGEYGLILGLITVTGILALTQIGSNAGGMYNSLGQGLQVGQNAVQTNSTNALSLVNTNNSTHGGAAFGAPPPGTTNTPGIIGSSAPGGTGDSATILPGMVMLGGIGPGEGTTAGGAGLSVKSEAALGSIGGISPVGAASGGTGLMMPQQSTFDSPNPAQ